MATRICIVLGLVRRMWREGAQSLLLNKLAGASLHRNTTQHCGGDGASAEY
jgi:hypothetical protein